MRSFFSLYGLYAGLIAGLTALVFPGHGGACPDGGKSFERPVAYTAPAVHPIPAEKPAAVFPPARDTSSHILSLRRIGRLFVLEATVDGETGFLVFDTGATGLVLNRNYFRDHVSSGEENSSGITGDPGRVDRISVDRLSIGDLSFTGLPANLVNLGHIENQRGIKVLGLFGFELIKSWEIIFSVSNGTLGLYPVDRSGNRLGSGSAFRADFTHPIVTRNNIMFFNAGIAGLSFRFCFDTGAETNALDAGLPGEVLGTVSVSRIIKLRGSGAAVSEVVYGVMNDFRYGGSRMSGMNTVITYMDGLDDAYGMHIDGVLGYDFISRGNYCINFAKEELGVSFIKQEVQ